MLLEFHGNYTIPYTRLTILVFLGSARSAAVDSRWSGGWPGFLIPMKQVEHHKGQESHHGSSMFHLEHRRAINGTPVGFSQSEGAFLGTQIRRSPWRRVRARLCLTTGRCWVVVLTNRFIGNDVQEIRGKHRLIGDLCMAQSCFFFSWAGDAG